MQCAGTNWFYLHCAACDLQLEDSYPIGTMTSGSKVFADTYDSGATSVSTSFRDAALCAGNYCPFVIPTYPFVQPPKYDATYNPSG